MTTPTEELNNRITHLETQLAAAEARLGVEDINKRIATLEAAIIPCRTAWWLGAVLAGVIIGVVSFYIVGAITSRFREPENWTTVVLSLGILGIIAWTLGATVKDRGRF